MIRVWRTFTFMLSHSQPESAFRALGQVKLYYLLSVGRIRRMVSRVKVSTFVVQVDANWRALPWEITLCTIV